jgi:spore coat protein H
MWVAIVMRSTFTAGNFQCFGSEWSAFRPAPPKEVKAAITRCGTVTAITILLVCMQAVSVGFAALKRVPGTSLFNATNVLRFRIDLSKADWNALEQSNRTYVAGSFAHGTNVLSRVGIRLKGKRTFQPLDGKPSFSIKFNEFRDQHYVGLSKIILNNSVTDPSYLREFISNEMFRNAGVPAPRVAHARVELNGRDLGFYVVVEGITKAFLRQHFARDNGNVYEGEFKDIDRILDQDGGVSRDQADLKVLRSAAEIREPSERWNRLAEVLDVDGFISFAVMEQMTGQNDGYSVQANNYRVYHDPGSDRFVFFPHGLDGTFTDGNFTIRAPMDRIVNRAVLKTHEGRLAYRKATEDLFSRAFVTSRLVERVSRTADRLRSAAINAAEASQIDLSCSNLCQIIRERATNISNQTAHCKLKPANFDEEGVALLAGWQGSVFGKASLEEKIVGGRLVWHLQSHEELSRISYRTRVLLDPGKYVFSGEIRVAKVEPSKTAHLRAEALFRPFEGLGGVVLYAIGNPRKNFVIGNSDWTEHKYPFEIEYGPQEIELAWEFVESKGEAWLRKDSFRLKRQ